MRPQDNNFDYNPQGTAAPGIDDSFGSGLGASDAPYGAGTETFGTDYGYADAQDWFMDFDPGEVEDAVLDVYEDVWGSEGTQMFEEIVYDPDFSLDRYFEELVSEYEGLYFEDSWLDTPHGAYEAPFGAGAGTESYGTDFGYSEPQDWFMDFDPGEVEDTVLDLFEDVMGPEGAQMFEDILHDPDFSLDGYFEELVTDVDYEGWTFEDGSLQPPAIEIPGPYEPNLSAAPAWEPSGPSLTELTAELNGFSPDATTTSAFDSSPAADNSPDIEDFFS